MLSEEKMVIVYNMGNFSNGKTKQTESKDAVSALEKIGYTLISVSWLKFSDWIKKVSK